MKWNQKIRLLLATACLWAGGFTAAADSYYKEPPLFSTAPSPEKSLQTIARFGPVGMGIDLIQPAFTMKIHNIEEGSPAAATGKLQAGQIIETINGQKLANIDPRIQLGQILAEITVIARIASTNYVIGRLRGEKPTSGTFFGSLALAAAATIIVAVKIVLTH